MTIAITGATGQLAVSLSTSSRPRYLPARSLRWRAPLRRRLISASRCVRPITPSLDSDQALAGVDTLLLISSSEVGQRAAQHHNVIETAKKAGVKRIVYTSLLRADASPLSLADEHRVTEVELRASGIPFTILRNGWYTENYTGSIGGAVAGGAFIGSTGEGKTLRPSCRLCRGRRCRADRRRRMAGKTYELAADDALYPLGPCHRDFPPDRQGHPVQKPA